MIQIQRQCYDSAHEAQTAPYVSPDPRIIDHADNVDVAVEKAKAFIKENNFKGNIEVLDYTPYTAFSPAKREYLKEVALVDGEIVAKTHPDAKH